MSCKGLIGFLHQGEVRAIEISDAKLDQAGPAIADFFLSGISLEQLNENYAKIEWGDIADMPTPTTEQFLRQIYEGTIQSMIDAKDFAEDYQKCQYAYLINLDDEELEIYKSAGSRNLTTCQHNNLPMVYYGNYDLADIRDFWSRAKTTERACDLEIEL
jgi:hypothetical protein